MAKKIRERLCIGIQVEIMLKFGYSALTAGRTTKRDGWAQLVELLLWLRS